jgi:hypothetical protein
MHPGNPARPDQVGMDAARCRNCNAPLPWAEALKVSGALCTRCLKVWLARQREREREVPA